VATMSALVGPALPTVAVINPASRDGVSAWTRWEAPIRAALNLVEVAVPDTPEAFVTAVRGAVAQGIARVLVAGGDGTVSLAAQVLAGTSVALGVIPAGTGNTFAYGLELPRDERLIPILASGGIDTVDVGVAETPGGVRRLFLNSLTIGVSARLVELLTPEAKRRLGWWAWPRHLRRALSETPILTVHLEGPEVHDRFLTRQLVIANGRQLAGPIRLPDTSSLHDARLDVFRLGGPSRGSMMRVAWGLFTGGLLTDRAARFHRVSRVTVTTTPPAACDVDGEVWHPTPVACHVWPGALQVIVPDERKPRAPRLWPP
jgi:diacylglycerol kinase (ATP)